MIKTHERNMALPHGRSGPMSKEIHTIDFNDVRLDGRQQLTHSTEVGENTVLGIVVEAWTANAIQGGIEERALPMLCTGHNNSMVMRRGMCSKITGFFGEVGVDTTFPPINIQRRQITNAHGGVLSLRGVIVHGFAIAAVSILTMGTTLLALSPHMLSGGMDLGPRSTYVPTPDSRFGAHDAMAHTLCV